MTKCIKILNNLFEQEMCSLLIDYTNTRIMFIMFILYYYPRFETDFKITFIEQLKSLRN